MASDAEWAPIVSGRPPAPSGTGTAAPSSIVASPRRLTRLGLLGVVDDGASIVRRHAALALAGSGLLLAPSTLASVLVARALAARFEVADGVFGGLRALFGSRVSADPARVSEVLSLVIGSLCVTLVGGYIAEIVVRDRFGGPIDFGVLAAAFVRRFPRLILVWLLGHSWLFAVLAAFAVHPALGVLVTIASGFPVIWFLFAVPVLVGEGATVRTALRRSRRLANQRFDMAFTFAITSAFVGLWLRAWLAGLPRLLEATHLLSFGSLRWLAEGVASQLGQLVGIPIVAAATTVAFIDTRVRLEGVDLLAELAEP